jgi:putative transposase
LKYKAESAGVLIREVNPAYTSQICNSCGVIKKLKLSDRVYVCDDCGFVIDRDVNAALNIMDRGCSESSKYQCISN